MMAFRFSVLLQLSSCTYVYNYFSENARIKFIPIDADVSGVVMAYFCFIFQFPNLICYGLVDWLIRYPMTAVVTVVFTSCPTRGGQRRRYHKIGWLVVLDLTAFETVFQSISGHLPERGRKQREVIIERKNVQTTPTCTYCKRNRPLPYYNPSQ